MSDIETLPYHGQPLVPFDSFMRKLPRIVADQQRLEYDAIVMASDIVTLAYNQLRHLAIEVGPNSDAVSETNVPIGIGASWTIVDQLHAIRQLIEGQIQSEQMVGPKTKKLLESLSVASKMRNRMDHLKDNIGNISKIRGPQHPLFGSVSYIYLENPGDINGYVVIMYSGALVGKHRVPMVNPIDKIFVLPVGLFQFSAFGHSLKIEPVLQELREYFEIMIPDIERQFTTAAASHASENGIKLDELLESGRGTFGIVLVFGPSPKAEV